MNIKELIEQFNNFLYETKEQAIYLYEMSTPLGKVKDNAHNLSRQIIKHILKCVMYGKEEQQTLHHWSHELTTWLRDCMIQIKGSNRYPRANELYTWLTDYYSNAKDIKDMRDNLEQDYTYQGHKPRINLSNEHIYAQITSILEKVCELTADKEITDDKVQDVLEKYILG